VFDGVERIIVDCFFLLLSFLCPPVRSDEAINISIGRIIPTYPFKKAAAVKVSGLGIALKAVTAAARQNFTLHMQAGKPCHECHAATTRSTKRKEGRALAGRLVHLLAEHMEGS
jgi:hypothetical protein